MGSTSNTQNLQIELSMLLEQNQRMELELRQLKGQNIRNLSDTRIKQLEDILELAAFRCREKQMRLQNETQANHHRF